MSRVAKNPINIPQGVEISFTNTEILVKGVLGSLSMRLNAAVKIKKDDNVLRCIPVDDKQNAIALSGTIRALLANMIIGVNKGFEKKLLLSGVGYRAQTQGDSLSLTLGFSHPVIYKMPQGIKCEVPSQTEIIIKGANNQQVGQVAAEIRAYRKPEPYKGKGVRYADEIVILKETKKK